MVMKKAQYQKGCIKDRRGPWVVQRVTKKGVVTSLRFPSEREREQNKEREKRRREMTRGMYLGLRIHGNYKLPKHADNHDLLKALCDEAGWHVEDDGTIHRKNAVAETVAGSAGVNFPVPVSPISSINQGLTSEEQSHFKTRFGCIEESAAERGLDLTLKLSLPGLN